MKASRITTKYRRRYWLFLITSIILNLGPLVYYGLRALLDAELIHQKITLCMTVFIVLILTAISLVNKIVLRSRLWIILIGIYICLEYILTPLILIAACQILDELIISPLKSRFKNDLNINKQIDARMDSDG
jgi:hypothetical protein